MKAMLAEMRQQGAAVYDREAAIVLRAVEQGARETRGSGGGDTAYLALIGRLLRISAGGGDAAQTPAKPTSSLILP
jgi:hypothetical protein